MSTHDAATAVFYGQMMRDCGCGCGGGCLGTAVRTAARDAALNSLYKSERSRDTWSVAAREAAARTRAMHAKREMPREAAVNRGVHLHGSYTPKVGEHIDHYHKKTGEKMYSKVTKVGGGKMTAGGQTYKLEREAG